MEDKFYLESGQTCIDVEEINALAFFALSLENSYGKKSSFYLRKLKSSFGSDDDRDNYYHRIYDIIFKDELAMRLLDTVINLCLVEISFAKGKVNQKMIDEYRKSIATYNEIITGSSLSHHKLVRVINH